MDTRGEDSPFKCLVVREVKGRARVKRMIAFLCKKKSVCADGEELERFGDWITGEF